MSAELYFTIRVWTPPVLGDFAIERLPQRALLALLRQVEQEIQARAALCKSTDLEQTRRVLANDVEAARYATRKVRALQRIVFVLTDEWPSVDLERSP